MEWSMADWACKTLEAVHGFYLYVYKTYRDFQTLALKLTQREETELEVIHISIKTDFLRSKHKNTHFIHSYEVRH